MESTQTMKYDKKKTKVLRCSYKMDKKINYFTEFEFISKTIFFNSFTFSNFIIKSILYSSNLNINLLFFQTKTLFRCLQFSSYIYCLFVNIVDHTQNIILVALKIIDHHIVIWMFSLLSFKILV